MKTSRVLAAVALLLSAVAQARGHDTGFGHSRRTLLFTARPEEVVLEYRIALSADEALVEMTRMDRGGDGRVSREEKDRYFADRARELSRGWEVTTAGGERIQPGFVRVELGHSLTQTYRFSVATVDRTILFTDANFLHKPGPITILSGPGLKAEAQAATNLSHAERISVLVTRSGN